MTPHVCDFPCKTCLRTALGIEIPESVMSPDEALLALVNPEEYRRQKIERLKETK